MSELLKQDELKKTAGLASPIVERCVGRQTERMTMEYLCNWCGIVSDSVELTEDKTSVCRYCGSDDLVQN